MSQLVRDQASKNLSSDLESVLNAEFWMGKNGYHYAILKDQPNRYAVRIPGILNYELLKQLRRGV